MSVVKLRQICAIAAMVVLSACPDGTSPPAVASVQMTSTSSNPRVGESATIGATPVTSGGVAVQGVTCTFTSGSPSVATVNPTTGSLSALSEGTTVITADCGGVKNTLTITVRPPIVTLTINKTGAGAGAVFATPAGLSYDRGTSVSVTATANSGSTFNGWSGACTGTTQPCVILMSSNMTLGADFTDGETFTTSASFGGTMSSVSDPAPPGCSYPVAIQITSLNLLVQTSAATGTANTTVTVSTPNGSCQGQTFGVISTGTLTVSGSSISGSLVFFSTTKSTNTQTLTIAGTRSGSTITGTISVNQKLYNGSGVQFTSTGGPFSFTATKTP